MYASTVYERVLIAMSGGVDSAVAAARLCDMGHEVVGVTLHLWDYPDDAPAKSRCCAPEDAHDARTVADFLGIPHYTFDRRELFAREVVDPFVDAYLHGHTPSPCVSCNRTVKIRELLSLADRLGAARIATGHYAKVAQDDDGKMRLYRGRDRRKDQSYFLHMLSSAQLARLVLPLADAVKEEVRAEAIERNLPRADKGESQELCFVSSSHYARFVEERATDGRIRPGKILNRNGEQLGEHGGVHRFTIGQRRGLGIALGEPAFVTSIDESSGAVTVGPAQDIYCDGAEIYDTTWADDITLPLRAQVKVRSHHEPADALITRAEGKDATIVRFSEAVRAVSPGQIAVAYDGDRVLGGGTIRAARRLTEVQA